MTIVRRRRGSGAGGGNILCFFFGIPGSDIRFCLRLLLRRIFYLACNFRREGQLSCDHLPYKTFVYFDFGFLSHCQRMLRSVRISAAKVSICASRAKVRSGASSVERPTPALSGSSSLLNFER